MMRVLIPALVTLLLTGGVALSGDPDANAVLRGNPAYGSFGFDVDGMKASVKPGDDFYKYANGTWLDNTEIPGDRSQYGMFTKLAELSANRKRDILEAAAKQPGSKIGAFYASFMDEKTADAKGMEPIKSRIAAIKNAKDKTALAAVMASLQKQGVDGLVDVEITQDDKNPSAYIARLHQHGLGLPATDYYLKADDKLASVREAYGDYLAALLTLAGEKNASNRAHAVVGFETKLAATHWSSVDSRDVDKTYNRWRLADFSENAPGLSWPSYLGELDLTPTSDLFAHEPSALTGEAKAWSDTRLSALKDWLMLRMIDRYAPYLSRPFVDANFAFSGTVLTGTPQNRPRWKRGATLVSDEMSEAVGQVYVAEYFSPDAKKAADQLVSNIINAYRQRLSQVKWMAPATREKALTKLASFKPMIGYPDKWRD